MNGRMKVRKMNDKGSTLVEIIVSVLIIGIVFVPLLFGMTSALKANEKAEQDSFAEIVAVNSLETVKTMGYEAIKAKFAGGSTSVSASDFTSNSGATLTKVSDTEFRVSGMAEGDETFTAKITFEDLFRGSTDIENNPKQNEVTYNHFTEISEGKTCLIRCLKSEDDSKLEALMSQSSLIPSLESARKLVTVKETVFTLGRYSDAGDENGENKGRYYVKRDTKYKVQKSSNGIQLFDPAFEGLWPIDGCFSSAPELLPSDAFGGPDTYIICYSSLKDANKLNELNTTNKENIVIKKEVPGDIKVFIFITDGKIGAPDSDASSNIPNKMNITLINTAGGSVKIYCSAKTVSSYSITKNSSEDLIDLGATYTPSTFEKIPFYSEYSVVEDPSTHIQTRVKNKQGVVDIEEGKQLYNVKIEIYDNSGVWKTTKESTIIE